jgi:hypothetical protein
MNWLKRNKRLVALFGIGWVLGDILPPKPHFGIMDGIILVLALFVYFGAAWTESENKTKDQ